MNKFCLNKLLEICIFNRLSDVKTEVNINSITSILQELENNIQK
jgi:hypothetical protein